jgi:hypothetical protein
MHLDSTMVKHREDVFLLFLGFVTQNGRTIRSHDFGNTDGRSSEILKYNIVEFLYFIFCYSPLTLFDLEANR